MRSPRHKARNARPKVIFLVGPTAVGKSALAIKLARKINAEIISMDSMQVYKGLDIVTSKPSKEMQEKIPHHLLDVVLPNQEFDVNRYRKLALGKIRALHKRGKIPLFVGGTGLYLSIIIDGIFKDVKKDDILREKLYKQGRQKGSVFLYDRLKKIDPDAASKIHPNDLKRIVRALEVYRRTGQPISKLRLNRKGLGDKYEIKIFGLHKDRKSLYNDINLRVDKMFELGLIQEVRDLIKSGLSLTCGQAIGTNELKGYLDGRYDLEAAKALIKKNSRRYAKRQLTWFRKDTRVRWVSVERRDAIKEILRQIKEKRSLAAECCSNDSRKP